MDFSDAELSFQVSPETERFLCERLLDQNQPIAERFRALNSLRNLSGAAPRNALIQATRDTSNLLAREAAFALGQMQDAEAIPALESVRNDRSLHPIVGHEDSVMGLSKTEVNLRRLLATAPQQQNKAKLVHYVATLREQLEQLAEERSPEGLPRVSKAQLNEYSEKIEAIAAKLDVTESSTQVPQEPSFEAKVRESSSTSEGESIHSPKGLRRRFLPPAEQRSPSTVEDSNTTKSVKLDAAAHAHIEKHRKLQEDLTDEMIDLARQLKESSLMMSQSIKNTEKTLDSTEKAVEQSLASTGHANTRAVEVYSQSLKTSCFTWLLIFVMTCIFIMVVLLIRVT